MTPSGPGRVVLLTDFARVRGGASGLAMLQADMLLARGMPVTVIAGDDAAERGKGAEVILLGGKRLTEQGRLSAALGGLWNGHAHRAVRDWIATNDRADTIYHVHGIQQTLSPSVLAALAPVRDRVVLHAHDFFLACPNGGLFDYRSGKTCERRPMSVSCIARNCDKRSYPQKLWRVARQGLQNRGAAPLMAVGRVILIHEGMAPRLWSQGGHPRQIVVRNPATAFSAAAVDCAGNAEFLYVGDIHRYKGVFLLAEAARRAGVPLRFVGDGQDRPMLEKDYPEHQFDGWADRNALSRRIATARAVVAPTLGPEPFGLAPVEALLSGVPVVLSDSMLLAGDIRASGAGAVFAAGQVEPLAAVLKEMAADDAMVRQMADRAQGTGRRVSLRPEDWIDRLLSIYAEMLARPANGAEP